MIANTLTRAIQNRGEERAGTDVGFSFSEWANMVSSFGFNGTQYTVSETPQEQVANTYQELGTLAYQQDGIVFACMAVRQMLFRQMRFQFRRRSDGQVFGDTSLRRLEYPWPGGTTSDLLARAITHHDLGGNAFFTPTRSGGMGLLRPDWVDMVIGSNQSDASAAAWDPDAQVIGYVYHPGGRYSDRDPITYLAEDVAHWAMYPDPSAQFRGMSWLTPVIREIMSDKAATDHKLKFFEKAATPNMLVKIDTDDIAKYEAYIKLWKREKEGVGNAYSTAFLARGADATVIGKDMQQMDFKVVQGAGEVRIAAAAQVPPVIVGLSEGLSGSSLNAGNYTAARRRLVDGTGVPMWENVCGTLDNIIAPVNGGRLWPDTSDVAFMKEDQQDAADIQSTKSTSLNTLITAGYTPESAVKAIVADDFTLLEHTGRFSVQLQPPGTGDAEDTVGPDGKPADAVPATASTAAPAANGVNGHRDFEISDRMLDVLLRDVEREREPMHVHVTTPPTTVEIREGAVQSHISLELPSAEASRVEFGEGAFTSHVSVEPGRTDFNEGAFRVDAPADVRIEEGAIQMRVEPADVTIEAGAVQSHVTVEPSTTEIAEGAVSVTVEPARTEIAAGAIQSHVTVEPSTTEIQPGAISVSVEPARTEIQEGAIQTHLTVEQPDVQVDVQPADVRTEIAEGALQVTVEPADVAVTVEGADITIERDVQAPPNVTINVEPTPIEVTNEVNVKQPNKIVTFDRDSDGNIIEASTEDAEGDQ